ncbi:MAG: hypothetical protein ABIK62_00890 [candidate division WOR-3 bacterium]
MLPVSLVLLAMVARGAGVDLSPCQTTYGTGRSDGNINKLNNTIRWSWSDVSSGWRGWAAFPVHQLPDSFTHYRTVKLHYYERMGSHSPICSLYWAHGSHPLGSQGNGPLWDSLGIGFPLGRESYNPLHEHVVTLPSWAYWPARPKDTLVVGFVEGSHVSGADGYADGWQDTYPPYLECIP